MATKLDPTDPQYKPPRHNTYEAWQEEQNIPRITGFFIEDINTVEVSHWDLKGVPCAFVNLEGTGGTNDAYVCEIPPGAHTEPQKHARRDSNPQPPDSKSDALSIAPRAPEIITCSQQKLCSPLVYCNKRLYSVFQKHVV